MLCGFFFFWGRVARVGRTIVGVAGPKDATASLASKAAIGRGWRCHKIINK